MQKPPITRAGITASPKHWTEAGFCVYSNGTIADHPIPFTELDLIYARITSEYDDERALAWLVAERRKEQITKLKIAAVSSIAEAVTRISQEMKQLEDL